MESWTRAPVDGYWSRVRLGAHAAYSLGAGPKAVPHRRGHDYGYPQRDQVWADLLSFDCAGVHQPSEGLQRHLHGACHKGWRADSSATGPVRAGAPLSFRPRQCRSQAYFRTLRSTRGFRSSSAAWSRRSRTRSAAAVRHASRHPQCGPVECTRDAQHSRRTIGHLQGRLRQSAIRRPAAAGRAGRLRGVPQATRRSGARGRARSSNTARSPTWRTADVLRRVLVRTGMTRRTCEPPAATMSTLRWMRRRSTRPTSRTLRTKGAIIYAVATANSIGGVPWSPAGERTSHGSWVGERRTCRPCCLMGMRRTALGRTAVQSL